MFGYLRLSHRMEFPGEQNSRKIDFVAGQSGLLNSGESEEQGFVLKYRR
jgi:hypothetical protein